MISLGKWLISGGFVMLSAATAYSDSMKLRTPRGVEIEVEIAFPEQLTGKSPVVIIAPGQGYHMDRPIIVELSEKLVRSGTIVARFNWAYFTADPLNGQPSPDLKSEIEDLQTVINHLKSDERSDLERIILVSKSLGTIVSNEVFRIDSSLRASVFMTPVCTESQSSSGEPLPAPISVAEQYYPGLIADKRPMLFALGNSDPLCKVNMLYDFVKSSEQSIPVLVFGGNHSLNLGPDSDPIMKARNARNVDAATSAVAHWINLILEQ
jgi:predicted alpha/beta-hydrolase family hydrolase